jgi:hypothetical protein
MKSKYDLMTESEYKDPNGNVYPDLATFPINSFKPTTRAIDYQLSEYDILYFYKLIYDFYGDFNFYDDITLWLNDIPYISDTRDVSDYNYNEIDYRGNFGKYIKFYTKQDIDKWYLNSINNA